MTASEHQRYVLGFLFSQDFSRVALIQKLRPTWMRGLWNGLGGKVNPGELSSLAMVREFKEEASVETEREDWKFFLEMRGSIFSIACYAARSDDYLARVRTAETELVNTHPVDGLKHLGTIGNLKWLIPMAIDCFREDFRGMVNYE